MLRVCSLLTVLLTSSVVFAGQQLVRFRDASGRDWQRWVITEPQDERTLLLVVENPTDTVSDVSQRVVYRHSFAHGSHLLLSLARDFENLRDQQSRAPISAAVVESKTARTLHQPIWSLKQDHWTLQHERDYSAWIQNTVTEKFLQGSDLNVDCADLSLTLRWVYAHDHGLPAANTLSGAGGLFGQWSGTAAWDQLPTNADWRRDARFKAALRYLLNSAYTHTILNDLYPTEISREYITPGAIRLTITDVQSGHTQVIHHVGHDQNLCPDGQCVSVFYGDTPASETIFDDVAWLLNLKNGKGGFLRWRWPVYVNGQWSLTSGSTMPGYSLEQFSHPSFTTDQFENYINTQLFWSTTITDRATTLGYSLIESLKARVQISALGDAFCALQKCAKASSAYDSYSTPERDERYLSNQARFADLVVNDDVDVTAQEYQAFLEKAAQPLFAGGGLTYADYIFDHDSLNENLSSDPTQSFNARWGLSGATSAQLQWANEAVWETLWAYRDAQVQAAQRLCADGQSASASCLALATTVIDNVIKGLRQTLRRGALQLDHQSQTQLMNYVTAKNTAETGQAFCSQMPTQRCTFSDFIYSSSQAVERMSAAPTDLFAKRYGF